MNIGSFFSIQKLPLTFTLLAAVLLPFFFIPATTVPFLFTKGALLLIGITLAIVFVLVGALGRGTVGLLLHPLALATVFVALATLVSAFISSYPDLSFVGYRLEPDTAIFTLLAVLLGLLSATQVKTRREMNIAFYGIFAAWAIVVLHLVVRMVVGYDVLSFGIFTQPVSTLLGKWNDLGIFSGLIVLLSLIALTRPYLSFAKLLKLLAVLIVAMFITVVVNFTNVLVVIAVGAVLIAGYLFFRRILDRGVATLSGQGKAIAVVALIVAATAGYFAFEETVANNLSTSLGIVQLEARPSWQSTFDTARSVYEVSPIFGSGPNTYGLVWQQFKPAVVNNTIFWSVQFPQAVGHIPTAAITGGLLVGLAWIVLLLLFILSGYQFVLRSRRDGDPLSLGTKLAFVAALYLWIFSVLYTPGTALLVLAFFFTGLFIAGLRIDGLTREMASVPLDFRQSRGFVGTGILLTLLIIVVPTVWLTGSRFFSALSYQQANAAALAGEFDRSEVLIDRAIQTSSVDEYHQFGVALAVNRLLELAQTEGNSEELQQQFQTALNKALAYSARAIEENPDNYLNWMAAGSVYQTIVPFQVAGAYDNALAAYERARVLAPVNAEIPLTMARLEIANNNIEAAQERINDALQLKNDYTAAVFLRAQIEVSEGNTAAAIRSLESATQFNPYDPTIQFALGFLRYNARDFEGASQALEQAVILNQDYANALYFLGLSYFELDRNEEAVAAFSRVSALNPENQEVTQILANLRAGRSPFAQGSASPEDRDTPPIGGE